MLLLIDNYDSFTHNLARYFRELGQQVEVVRNDQITVAQIAEIAPRYLVFSPGPCTPNEAGVTLSAVKAFAGNIPMLGVCLGHQAIGQVFGANVIVARHIMHGKTSMLQHSNSPLFNNIETQFQATRYHSLILDAASISEQFQMTCWCDELGDIEPMAIEHKSLPIVGVQFHPESLLTPDGHKILQNFISLADSWYQSSDNRVT
ncbi:aminodeoxychorismate/anthranilate synthase component II [Aliiglaciecola litoralis]|uniref:Aminodeoxychorismate synthase component II n=1 Tax=Aliiglaciecola litoralis TaxID=582857 RepID=A0ABN1LPV1_9ALTE